MFIPRSSQLNSRSAVTSRTLTNRSFNFFPRLLLLLTGMVCLPVPALFAQESDFVETELQKLIDAHKMRAAIVVYVDEDTQRWIKLGEISDENRTPPNDDSTLFEIGSITKVFTALLVQTLVDEELLDWDDSLATCLPDIEFVNDSVSKITLRELATHRSGLPRLPTNFTATEVPGDPMDPYANYGRKDLVTFLQSFDPEQLVKAYAYSNFGFATLGFVASETLSESYSEALHERVLKPLEMSQTTATQNFEENTELAAGYSFTANMGLWNFNVHASAGSIRSTAADMLKFIRANFVESDEKIHHAIRAIRALQFNSNQALGWITETSAQNSTIFLHSGQTGGYASFVAVDPENKRGWAILTTSNESAAITRLGASFYREISEPAVADLAPYVGVFHLGGTQYMTVSNADGQLQAQVSGQQPFVMQHTGEHQFTLIALNHKAEFQLTEEGIASTMTWTQPGVSIDAERVDDRFGVRARSEIVLESDLSGFAGQYRLLETTVIEVRVVDDRIFVRAAGQPEFRVFPMSPTRFFYKAVDAEIEFELDESQTATGFVLHQGGEYRATRINNE